MSLIITPNQDVLVSGTNIKPVNGSSLLGSTNLITDYSLLAYAALGGATLGQSVGLSLNDVIAAHAMVDGTEYFIAVWLPQAVTLNGVRFYQSVQGNYTSDNNNKVGLYTYSGGTTTLVANSSDDGTLWKGTSNTWVSKNFASTYPAAAGLYFVALLYNSSAQVAAPQLGGMTANNVGTNPFDFTNSAKIRASITSRTDLLTPAAMSGLSASALNIFVTLY